MFYRVLEEGFVEELSEKQTGTSYPAVRDRDVRAMPFAYPSLPEQRRIVDAIEEQFSRMDAGVASLQRAERNLAGLRASILKAAVEGSLNGSHGATGSLPDGWIMASPDDLAAPEKNALAIGPFGSNLKVSDYATTGVPLVFVRNIRRRRFDGGDNKFVTPEKAAELSSHQVEPGDLLITKMGDPPGDAAVYSGSGPAIITADCIKLRPHPDVDVRYLDIAFNSPVARSQILAITRGVAQKKISLGRFRKEVKVPLPPLQEQMAIVADVERSLSLVEAMEGTIALGLARAESVRRSLLREAFVGRLTHAEPVGVDSA
jgi:type I restriction enzyme S subunit